MSSLMGFGSLLERSIFVNLTRFGDVNQDRVSYGSTLKLSGRILLCGV
jgi:hypothetical protein